MKAAHLFLPLLLSATALCQAVSKRYTDNGLVIRFNEPIVHTSELYKQNPGNVTITGDADHQPKYYWTDQDTLSVTFARGTSVRTAFQLSFKPGQNKYLGGDNITPDTIVFSCPMSPLSASRLEGTPTTTFCVFPRKRHSQESIEFSPASPITFSFREVKDDGSYGPRTVQGLAEPATLAQLEAERSMALQALADAGVDWKTVSGDTVVPGFVIVRAPQELDPAAMWELVMEPQDDSGVTILEPGSDEREEIFRFRPEAELGTGFIQYVSRPSDKENDEGKKPEMRLKLKFSAPVRQADLPAIFSKLSIRCGEHIATPSEDSKTKILTVDGKETRFSLVDEAEENSTYEPRINQTHGEQNRQISYRVAPTTDALVLSVSDMVPADLELIVPKGTAAANGLSTACDHLHRLSFNPAYPQLGTGILQLPLHGDHHFRLLSTNAKSVELKAWHIDAAKALEIVTTDKNDPDFPEKTTIARLQYRLAAEEKRHELLPAESDHMLKTIRMSLSSLQIRHSYQAAKWQTFLNQLTPLEPHRIMLATGEPSAVLCSQESAVNLDTLTGGNTKPGFYIISCTPTVSDAVRKQAEALGVNPNIFETPSKLLLQVTDLFCSNSHGKLIITRLSDGSLVREADVYDKKGTKHALTEGVFHRPKGGRATEIAFAVVGEDYTTTDEAGYHSTNTAELRQEIIADRPLYRPGDTVNLRGILRHTSAEGDSSIAQEERLIQLRVRKPNGEILLQRDLSLDAFGAWADSFTLPTGEDDITGDYTITASIPGKRSASESISIACEVFRRDAFEAQSSIQVDQKIAPRTFSATVQATDLNGTPLSNATLDLNISCTHNMISLKPEDTPTSRIKTSAKTDAQGQFTLQGYISDSYSPHSAGRAGISIAGSVANDRQEYKKLASVACAFFSADFMPNLQGKRLHLYKANSGKEIPLDREQKLHVRIMGQITQQELLPGGIVISQRLEKCMFEQEITVPANCTEGYLLPLDAIRNTPDLFKDQAEIHVSGTDAAGHKLQAIFIWHPWWRDEEADEKEPTLQVTHEQGKLQLQVEARRAGEAFIFVHSRKGSRMQTVQVNGQKDTLYIPLQEGEDGELRVQFMQTMQGKSKLFTNWSTTDKTCHIPRPDMQLHVQLTTPEQPVRPGSELTITGQVTLPGGAPSDAAVTLYAVDAGMLSVAPYTLPDLEASFGNVRISTMWLKNMEWDSANTIYADSLTLMAPVWKGDIIGPGRYIPLVSHVRKARNTYMGGGTRNQFRARALADEDCEEDGVQYAPAPAPVVAAKESIDTVGGETGTVETPRLRTNFAPVAVWQAALRTDAEGKFSTTVQLPDTLTTWRIFAVALDKSGSRFGSAEAEMTANQPVMITPGTPFFMSLGDCLHLPLTITNNTKEDATWQVSLEGANAPQSIALKAGSTGTLYFDFTATQEGDNTLRWMATAPAGGDAVEGRFPVRFPAPTLKETHHLVQTSGQPTLQLSSLPAPELAQATRNHVEIELSANPLLHLASCMEFVLSYPYGCTEQTASGLMPWIFHSRLAPFSPTMEAKDRAEVNLIITQSVEKLFKRQRSDGGLGYWDDSKESCLWASAHAAMVFTIAEEQGYALPTEPMKKLREYLSSRPSEELQQLAPFARYAIGRACGNETIITQALEEILRHDAKLQARWIWCAPRSVKEDIRFISALRTNPANCHTDFLQWMRSRGHDYRHNTTWQSAWMLIALSEYLRLQPEQTAQATVQLQDGQQITLGNGVTRLQPPSVPTLAALPTTITTTAGTAYLNVKFRALPEKTEYPGVTEKGLQITRVYEKKDANGNWNPTTDFQVGDVVRVTLTCAKVADELQYFVLEDYLPSCMEAINPNVPSQAAGLNWLPWSHYFDHKEYLADRVRGFCTRWAGRNLLNMSYYARVKRAGTATAPPAQAQLMYEPQTYGLSPNAHIISK
ncbi:MAG: hypothetical protein IJB31_08340 [Akkermansia sp.]|nr:hypothetical protein [Akkermansia sp.]